MTILRRTLLSVVLASPAIAAPADAVRAERSLGSPEARLTAIECFSLTCPHCADFALESLPELRAGWIAPGKLRWVFYDFPTDVAALQAAMVARYLPPERYEPFIGTLFAQPGSLGVRRRQRVRYAMAVGEGRRHGSRHIRAGARR